MEPLINYLRCYCCVKNQLKMLIYEIILNIDINPISRGSDRIAAITANFYSLPAAARAA